MRQAGAGTKCTRIKFTVQQLGGVGKTNILFQYTNGVRKSSPSKQIFYKCSQDAVPVPSSTRTVVPHCGGLLGSHTTSYLPKEETSLTNFDSPGHVLLLAETINKFGCHG